MAETLVVESVDAPAEPDAPEETFDIIEETSAYEVMLLQYSSY